MKFLIITTILLSLKINAVELPSNECVTLKKTPGMTFQKCDSLGLLWLTGSPIERARAHGQLLGKEMTLENLDLFVALSVRGIEQKTFKFWFVDQALNYLVRWGSSAAPDSFHSEIQAMAEAADIDPVRLKRALLLPDIAAFSWALLSKQGKNLPNHGCTSAIYSDSSGQFLQGRNLDFPGSPSFDENPLLVIHRPQAGSKELKHVSIGTHGLQFSGITGFNEAGITFAVHQNYTRLLSFKGVPMPFVGELVLRSARTLDDAIEIIKSNRPGPLWTFVISDLNTGQAATVEVSNSHFNLRFKKDPLFAQTNHLQGDLRSELSLMDAGTAQNSKFRFDQALEKMSNWKKPTAEQMSRLLGHQNKDSSFSPITDVMKSLTIQSVIYEKAQNSSKKKFYVTLDSAPAPAGRWAQFDFDSFFQKEELSGADYRIFDFLQVSSLERDVQKKWTQVYSSEMLRDYTTVIEKLIPLASSPDSFLALAAMEAKKLRYTDSLVSAQRGLQASNGSTPPLIRQGLQWVEIISLWHLDKKDMVLSRALSLSNQVIRDPGLEKEVRLILQKKAPSSSSLSPGFDFFGGYLQGMPSRPKD